MSYSNYEASRFLGHPNNLYLFRYGDEASEMFAYNDAEEAVTFEGITYEPLPIDRGKINSSGTLDKTNLTITTPSNSGLADLFLVFPPSSVTTLIVRQGHLSDPLQEYKVVWSGRVLSCSRKGKHAEFSCEPVSTSLRRNGLRRRYQFGCPHALYSEECGASKIAATTVVTATAVASARVTVGLGWTANPAKYLGGLVEWTPVGGSPEVRTVLRIESDGAVLLLSGTTRGLTPGLPVKVILGCNHKSGTPAQPDGDCGPLHNNVVNFGGQERIPFKNPIGLTNQYY